MALDEPRDDDTCTTVEGVSFLLSEQDAQMVKPGRELLVDYSDGLWSEGFYVTTAQSGICGLR